MEETVPSESDDTEREGVTEGERRERNGDCIEYAWTKASDRQSENYSTRVCGPTSRDQPHGQAMFYRDSIRHGKQFFQGDGKFHPAYPVLTTT